jgi:hypothetical protein
MKSGIVLGTSILAILLGTTVFAGAQHDRHDEGNSHWQRGNGHEQEHGRPSPPQHQASRPEPRHEYHHEYHHEPREAVQRGPEHEFHGGYGPGHVREVRRDTPESHYVRQDIWARQRARDWQHEHRNWHERGGYHGYRIPEDRFRAHFGRGHWFRVHEVPVIVVERSPRFQFGGYWFSVVDPCPETWSPVWYRTDDIYIDYVNDGYYMYNRQHPGIAIAVNVSL